ncbi:hypothetical protein CH063_09660 [Colletotrichum higginsianum]|uniref:Uncharacterized protein n=1 Tax=Colletotrichum higginsianum (strain IMI 349063) TaxID=759273 RepID=H1VEG0_COLHI|nr:hypothetical protein CH063_09660 [Colletotrichum higginsianum]
MLSFFTFGFRPGPPPNDSSYTVDSARYVADCSLKQEILAGQTCPYSPARPCPTTLQPPCNRSRHVFSSPGCGTLAHDKMPPWSSSLCRHSSQPFPMVSFSSSFSSITTPVGYTRSGVTIFCPSSSVHNTVLP